MRQISVLLFVLILTGYVSAQKDGLGPYFGVGYSWFSSHSEDRTDFYGNYSKNFAFRLGVTYNNVALLTKFRQYSSSGQVNIAPAGLTSSGTFDQDLWSVMLRLYLGKDRDTRFFVQLGAVHADITESIYVEEFPDNTLNGTNILSKWGPEFGAGVEVRITSFLYVNAEVENSILQFEVKRGNGNEEVDLGGISFHIGFAIRPF